MNAPRSPQPTTTAYLELADYLRATGSALTPDEAVLRALKLWMETNRKALAPLRGYQWKKLFLPDGSRVRMFYAGRYAYAQVVEDELIYQGRPVSPRQMTLQVAGDGRNAWRDLWVRLPDEKHWTSAAKLRCALERHERQAPVSPVDAMAAAAKCMSDALTSALILVEHANAQSERHVERRAPKHRRQMDLMVDDCRAD